MTKQATLPFQREAEKDRMLSAAEILVANPERYPGMMQYLALRTLHRNGKPHDRENCPLCRKEAS